MLVIRQLAIILLFVAACYLVLGAPAFLDAEKPLDSGNAPATLFDTEPKAVVYGIGTLARPGRRVVLLGGSNVREGLRPGELSPDLDGIEVDNLAVGATNIRELSEIVDLAYRVTPSESHRDLRFVLGVWYGTFVDDARRWPDHQTSVDVEMLRYGLFARRDDDRPRPIVGGTLLRVALVGIRPVLMLSHIRNAGVAPRVEGASHWIANLMGADRPQEPGPVDRNVNKLSDQDKARALQAWADYMGPVDQWSSSGFEELVALGRRIGAEGGSLVVLDLPIPAWHAGASPYFAAYQTRKIAYLDRLTKIARVSYASLQDGFADDDFYDSAHPRPKLTPLWASRAAAALRPMLRD